MLLQPGAVPGPRRERTARAAAGAARDPPSPRPLASLSPLVGDLEHGTHRIPPGTDPRLRSSWLFFSFFCKKKIIRRAARGPGRGPGRGGACGAPSACEQPICCAGLKRFGPGCLKLKSLFPKTPMTHFGHPLRARARVREGASGEETLGAGTLVLGLTWKTWRSLRQPFFSGSFFNVLWVFFF